MVYLDKIQINSRAFNAKYTKSTKKFAEENLVKDLLD